MNSFFLQSLLSLILLSGAFIVRPQFQEHEADGEQEDIVARAEWERIRLCDPSTGRIPDHIREDELAFAHNLPSRESLQRGALIQSNTWAATGPYNVGGRTRAVAIDVANENTLLAGQVSGGLWKTTDGGSHWKKCTTPDMTLPVSCLCQDTRAGHQQTWYAGTGELWGNSSELNGSGIYKSTDNGESWTSIKSTFNTTPESWDNSFEFIWRIVVDHTKSSQDVLYAATALGCVQRSTDGGQSWTQVLGKFGNGYGYFSEVSISPSGILYATISQQTSPNGSSSVKGIYRSTDGLKWTNISPSFLPSIFGRIGIGIAPSDEKQVYFLAQTQGTGFKQINFAGKEDWTSLWKYTYQSGDGSGAGGTWDDRSQNLPRFGGAFGDFQTQNSYDLYVRVHPLHPEVVFVGGTNLCRSDDGFSTPTWNWMGGYGVGSTLPFYELYPNNHPDQHEMMFYPSNPDKVVCGCDGGVFRSDNVRAGNVQWTSLNNGYQTTQFYTCAIDHKNQNQVMIGGLQDNGTVFTNAVDATKPWTAPGLGDGSYCAIANDGNTYMSRQQGVIGRFDLDANGAVKRFARIDPKGTIRDSFLFVAPFCLDPNDNKHMLLPYRQRIYHCSDLSLVPWGTWGLDPVAETGWDTLAMPRSNKIVSAVALSTSPASRLYYGTQDGYLYRIDNYNSSSITRKDITGNLFSRGNIECICVNPHNADSLLVVFSNYSVQSLFFSGDGGTSWQAVGGNLESPVNGVGNGPSCRWATFSFVNGKPLVYVGTSVGLFCTALLNGSNTVWIQEGASTIGNAVVTMMDYRESDNFMAVATHGAGMYAGTVQDLPPAPDVPLLDSPENTKRAILASQNFSWKSAANASVYSLQVSTDAGFTSISSNNDAIKNTSFTVTTLPQGRKDMFWRVRAYGAGGISAYSEVRTFRTAIEAPVLLLPPGGQTNQPLNTSLSWAGVNGATSYHIQCSISIGFSNPILDTIISDTSVKLPTLLTSKRYFWHVASIDADGQGMYADPRNFVTTSSTSVAIDNTAPLLRCSPNPAADVLHISCEMLKEEQAQLQLCDVGGRLVADIYEGRLDTGVHEFSKDCSHLVPGFYIVRLTSAKGSISQSVLVRR